MPFWLIIDKVVQVIDKNYFYLSTLIKLNFLQFKDKMYTEKNQFDKFQVEEGKHINLTIS